MRLAPPPPTRSASAVYTTLAAQCSAVIALVVFETLRGRRLAEELAALDGDPRSPGAQAVVGAVTVFAVLILAAVATTAAAALSYLTWLTRACQADEPGAPALRSALAAWAVPLVNLMAPPMLLDRLWQGAAPVEERRGRWVALVLAWWLSLAATVVLFVVRLAPPADAAMPGLTGLGPLEAAVTVVAALLCAATVREITRLQTTVARAPRPATPPLVTVPLPHELTSVPPRTR
ncbi:DUF4328 domain-containing protein [Sinosporangium siamense]|uniref:DUF4328 domain-containing protein n=1 Tax=Sinosporangium siamense TaxID=1367973 RepID=A0A919RD09_9ACTN|nr:DUF4328 domain-containing protein [Sinosporangium siamense]GII91633.1 hypothetical protein Ssi02_18640 [Sinosporangium siamense]